MNFLVFSAKVRALIGVLLVVFGVSAVHPAFSQIDEATTLTQQVIELCNQKRYSEAIPLAQRALAIYEKTLGPDHLNVVIALNNLASVYTKQARYADTEPLY